MSDLLRFEIWQVFLLEKPLSCVESNVLNCWVKELLLRPSGNGGGVSLSSVIQILYFFLQIFSFYFIVHFTPKNALQLS